MDTFIFQNNAHTYMARHKQYEYKYAVRRYHRYGAGAGKKTSLHSEHMTKRNAKKSLNRYKGTGGKGYIVKL